MAISWSAYEGHLRVGIEVSGWTEGDGSGAITHTSAKARCSVKIYTGVDNWDFDDSQTLVWSDDLDFGDNVTFTNRQGKYTTVLRETKTFYHTYASGSYGTSPGTRKFTAELTGAYTEGTPKKSVTVTIPARPYDKPAAPTGVAATRVTDTNTTVTWVNHPATGEPYSSLTLQRSLNGGVMATVSSAIGGTTASYAYGTTANAKYRFQVAATNSAGSSTYAASADFYTTPSTPTACVRAGASGDNQVITWNNNSPGYTEYSTEVWRATNGTWALLATVASGGTTYTDTYPATHPNDTFQYKVRHKTTHGTQGVLYSAYSGLTTSTDGAEAAPGTPTDLSPNGGTTINGKRARVFTWTYNTADGSPQAAFEIQHRVAGNAWPVSPQVSVTSTASSWTLPADTYSNGQTIEWQVRTKGAGATYSDWSATATFVTSNDRKVVSEMNLATGDPEVDLSGYAWKNPTLLNNWVDYGAPYRSASYCRRAGMTILGGLIRSGTVNEVMFVLPAGYRPGADIIVSGIINAYSDGSAGTLNDIAVRINIYASTGNVVLSSAVSTPSNGYLSLEGITFPAEL